ncbi:MAG: hypothetical protein H6735_06485 [Alphaproteobacteria bacterium]|nr:hypothetical protein [Alphaproteobacteria bacterium]
MSPFANDVFAILRSRVPAPPQPGRLSYSDLVLALQGRNAARYRGLTPDSPALHAALGEVCTACNTNGLAPLSAIVVLFDNGRLTIPGVGYYEAAHPGIGDDYVARMRAWLVDVQQAEATNYPATI